MHRMMPSSIASSPLIFCQISEDKGLLPLFMIGLFRSHDVGSMFPTKMFQVLKISIQDVSRSCDTSWLMMPRVTDGCSKCSDFNIELTLS